MANKSRWKTAGVKLKSWRGDRVMSVIALDINADAAMWSTWEHGVKRPSLENALRLEKLTAGAIRIEEWDYSAVVISTMRDVLRTRKVVGT